MEVSINDCYVIASSQHIRECVYTDGVMIEGLVAVNFRIVQFKKHDHEWSFN